MALTDTGYNLNLHNVANCARRVTLALAVEPVALSLYGVKEFVLDEEATLRRVAVFHRGSARMGLTIAERGTALEVIRERDENRTAV